MSYFTAIDLPLSGASAGPNIISGLEAPGAGFAWRILGFFMVAAAPVIVLFISGVGTPKSGSLSLIAGQPVGVSMCKPGSGARWFQGGDNEAITMQFSAAVLVGGQIVAEKVPARS
jgi:hypothetical protein